METVVINYWAVLVAAVVAMVIGALWYSPILFSKPWMAAMGKKAEDMQGGGASYLIAFVADLVMMYVLAHFVQYAGATTMATGLATGFWAWLGFVVAAVVMNTIFEGRKWSLTFMYIGMQLVALLAGGWILAVWR